MTEPSIAEPLPQTSELLYYVGIGASAGGLEALEAFFSNMPARSGLAFIVIQHLSPDYKSMMVELLSKRTSMPVYRAENGLLVEADAVYLIPPRKQLTIFHGRLLLRDTDPSRGINLPIDVFFRSLAEDQAEKAVGIILSGTGSDGVRGIRAIKEAGGMIMVQDEESAKFDGMPRAAISTGLVDVVLLPEEMPDKLVSFTKVPFSTPVSDRPEALFSDEDGLTRIFALLREQTKVDFTLYKPSTVLRRINRRMAVNQSVNFRDYVRLLESRPGEVNTLYRELLIGVTSFFRDREVYEEMAKNVLPELLGNEKQREFRFWIAGCSTGEEAYTLAILARETMEKLKRSFDIKIFATDIDRDAILFAGNGLYPESIAADLPAGLLRKYFVPKDGYYQIHRSVREMVVFARHNLIKDPPFTNIDLLSCRNLLIYLQPILQRKVIEFANFSLNPHGILMLGTSETPGESGEFFEPVHPKYKLYRSRGRKHRREEGPQFKVSARDQEQAVHRLNARPIYRTSMREEERLLTRILDLLADEFIPVMAVVNERMELIHLTGDAQGYFQLPQGKHSNDITRMAVKELSIPLATGLQKIFHNGTEIKYTNVRLPYKESTRTVQLRIRLMPGKKEPEPLAAIFIQEMAQPREKKRGKVEEFNISREAEQRITDLEQDLQFTKENLQATIEELETSNEELQATNEELLASNEELQSTNEELQSVNEELHTVNAEYQSKILELTETTNDLENLIAATQIATLFLDENLEIRKFTPELIKIFRILQNDIGHPISHLAHKLEGIDIFTLIRDVDQKGVPLEREVQTSDGNWFLMRILPYEIGGPSASGLVLTFTNIDQLKRVSAALQTKADLARRLSFAIEQSPVSVVITDLHGQIEYVNSSFSKVSGYSFEEVLGQNPRLLKSGKIPDTVYQELWQTITSGGEWKGELLNKRKDGQPFWEFATISSIRDAEGNIINYISIKEDITERKRMEQELQASYTSYLQLFEEMINGFALHEIICDSAGKPVDYRFLALNSAFEEMTGLKKEQILGKTVKEILPETEEFWIERYGRVALEGKNDQFEGYSAALGRYYEARAYSPELGKFAVMFQDITERKETENALLRSTQLLNATQELTRIGGWQWDVQKQQMYWTDEVYRIHGMDPTKIEPGSEEHIKLSLSCYDLDDRETIEQSFLRCASLGESYDLEFPFTNLKGEHMRIRTRAHAIWEEKNIAQVVGNIIVILPPEKHAKTRQQKK